jgi:hypothetical protein
MLSSLEKEYMFLDKLQIGLLDSLELLHWAISADPQPLFQISATQPLLPFFLLH